MTFSEEMIDELIQGKDASEILGDGGLIADLTKRVLERLLAG